MNVQAIKELLYFYNPWWTKTAISPGLLGDYQRSILATLLSYLKLDRVIVVKGPRRTGKTTLLYQMIQELLDQGVSQSNIFYISCEEVFLRKDFLQVIDYYQELMQKNILSTKETIYFFLDEVQFLDDWSLQVKRYFDKKLPMKFIVSGSSASLIKKGAESLAGRTVEEDILPFSFFEYLSYHKKDKKLVPIINEVKKKYTWNSLPDINSLLPYKVDIQNIWNTYLQRGGFPHVFHVEDPMLFVKLLKDDIIDKVIYKDLVELYDVKKGAILEQLFTYISAQSSQLLNITNIANSLQLSREYTEKYLEYLENAFLVFRISHFSLSHESSLRKSKKAYLIDPGLMRCLGNHDEGKLVETIIAEHFYSNYFGKKLFYWRDKYEVDIIYQSSQGVIPIEVKYTNSVTKSDIKGLIKFLDTHNLVSGIIVTKDIYETRKIADKQIFLIPAWFFLLCLPLHDEVGVPYINFENWKTNCKRN